MFFACAAGAAGALIKEAAIGQEPVVPAISERLREMVGQAPLTMQLKDMSRDECRAWQARFKAKLLELLGPHQPPATWKTTVLSRQELPGFRREELLLEAHDFPPLPVYLLVPETERGRGLPCVLALHGHGPLGHHPVAGRDDLPGGKQAIAGANYDYGRQLAQRGYLVACPCFTPFGDRLGRREAFGQRDPCEDVFLRLLALGRVLMAENVRDARWALNLLLGHERADPDRVACVGLSYGGRMAMLTAAVEPRLRAAVMSGALNVMQERLAQPYSCGAQIIPGLLQYGDVPEIGGLIAPRPAVWEVGSRDGLMKPRWVAEATGRIERAYRALGADEKLVIDRFDGGHQWHGAAAYDVLAAALQ
jgi:dienelactone hydrolase